MAYNWENVYNATLLESTKLMVRLSLWKTDIAVLCHVVCKCLVLTHRKTFPIFWVWNCDVWNAKTTKAVFLHSFDQPKPDINMEKAKKI